MVGLKLAKLPERTLVKLSVQIAPDLNDALLEYAKAYEQAYGVAEPAAELVPAMLRAFIDSDRTFGRRGGT